MTMSKQTRFHLRQRPILFSTPMVLANLDGIKTQTRRIKGKMLKRINENLSYPWKVTKQTRPHYTPDFTLVYSETWLFECAGINSISVSCPYGRVGDILYGRETLYYDDHTPCWGYQADNEELDCAYTGILERTDKVCIPSIHMPKIAARLWLEITAIRVERLQDISEADASAEGVASVGVTDGKGNDSVRYQDYLQRYDIDHPLHKWCYSPKDSYKTLWESINGRVSWAENPYVWAITYKRIDKPKEVSRA